MTVNLTQIPWDLRRRGLKDSIRHDKRVREAIRKNLKELIAEETIITSDGKKKIKIPIRYLDQYRFKYGRQGEGQGVGQGPGKPGDVVAKDGEKGQGGEGKPGDEPGESVYEAEISLDELTKMMLEDLALPWLEDKDQSQITTETITFDDVRRRGSMANLDKRRTLYENIKRNAAKGQAQVAQILDDDLRFKVWNVKEEFHSNAAVYLLMDRSGSMTTDKKYIAKSFFFWLVRFLRLKYRTVDMVFIAHDTEAAIVPEKDFFTISNSGGTKCSSAYSVALKDIVVNHPKSRWNNYVFHFSDGDNWEDDNARCLEIVKELVEYCSMVGYGEINYKNEDSFYRFGQKVAVLWSTLHQEFSAITNPRFVTVAIKQKEDVYKALQAFLKKRE
jgi:sporulation protein YhbH